MEKNVTRFAVAIKGLMLEHKLSQLALATKLGIRQSQISNWLSGRTLPTYDSIQIFCKSFDVDANYFFVS